MKTSVLICILLCFVMLMSGCANTSLLAVGELAGIGIPNRTSGSFEELTIEASEIAGKKSESIMIYATYPVPVSESDLKAMAAYMQIEDYTISDTPASLHLHDQKGNAIGVFKDTGSIHFSSSEEDKLGDEYTGEVLTDEEYIRIVQDWLEGTGLLSPEYTKKAPKIYDNGIITKTSDDGQEYQYPTVKTVVFPYQGLDGIEVNGVAPRMLADISLDGKVVSVTKIQCGFKQYKECPLISIEESVKALLVGYGSIDGLEKQNARGTIQSARLAYYHTNDDAPFLLPVYIFEGESDGKPFTVYAYAIGLKYFTFEDGASGS